MISSRFVRYLAIVLTTTLALGCAESPTAPSAALATFFDAGAGLLHFRGPLIDWQRAVTRA